VAGIDLVRAQLRIAAGEPLPWTQEQLGQRGHAIEARIYAEDSITHLPQAGRVLLYREPSMPGIRIDSGILEGSDVSVHYDPLLAKLIAWGEDRDAARRRAIGALRGFPILGIRTNIPLLVELLQHPRFVSGSLDTRLVDTESAALAARLSMEAPPEVQAIATAARSVGASGAVRATRAEVDPWTSLRSVRV
jgi:acetyl-CoA/propionyl-CoA carboxylase biotin carboxyl carrier protein